MFFEQFELVQYSKYMKVQYHFIRKKCENKIIIDKYVPSKYRLADIITKALRRNYHDQMCREIGLICLD